MPVRLQREGGRESEKAIIESGWAAKERCERPIYELNHKKNGNWIIIAGWREGHWRRDPNIINCSTRSSRDRNQTEHSAPIFWPEISLPGVSEGEGSCQRNRWGGPSASAKEEGRVCWGGADYGSRPTGRRIRWRSGGKSSADLLGAYREEFSPL